MDGYEVQKLAETLKRQGLAVSMTEALEKAHSIMGVSLTQKVPMPLEESDDFDIIHSEKTINELLVEAGLSPHELTTQKKAAIEAEVGQIKADIEDIKHDLKSPSLDAKSIHDKMHHVEEEIEHLSVLKKDVSDEKPNKDH